MRALAHAHASNHDARTHANTHIIEHARAHAPCTHTHARARAFQGGDARHAAPQGNLLGSLALVGLVVASVLQMTQDEVGMSPFPRATLCMGMLAYCAVDVFDVFEPAVVLAGAAAGVAAWGAGLA